MHQNPLHKCPKCRGEGKVDSFRDGFEYEVCWRCNGGGLDPYRSGAELIREERIRQIMEKGFTPEFDDTHVEEELVSAAIALLEYYRCPSRKAAVMRWPWGPDSFKPLPYDTVGDLVKAGALLAAEIDRRIRAQSGKSDHEGDDVPF